MKLEDQEPNFLLSEAHEVPSPHQSASRAAKVAFTSFTSADSRCFAPRAGVRDEVSVLASVGGRRTAGPGMWRDRFLW